jgi:hypothetical protein
VTDDLTYERIGDDWVFSDGTVLPVVAGGSDAGLVDAPAAEPAAAEPVTPEPAAEDTFDPNLEADQYPKSYVERLRKEAAGYRTRAQEYDDVFGNIDPQDRQIWLGMARETYRDPKAGAEWMAKVSQGVLEGLSPEEAVDAAGAEPTQKPDAEGADDEPLTKAGLEKWYADRRAAEKATEEQESLVRSIVKDAEGLGYKENTADFNNLLWIAVNETGNDLSKAHEVMQASRQAIIDSWVEEKRKGGATLTPGTGVPTVGAPTQIKSMADAHRAAKARIEGTLGAR